MGKRTNKICVVIPMFGFGEYTKKCIGLTIENAGVGVDIVVVDDCSEVPFEDSRVKVIRLEKNIGFTGATNAGIEYAWNHYDYVHLLNNDTEPRPDFIKSLLDILDKYEDIGVACSVRETTYNGIASFFNYPIDCLSGYCMFTYEDLEDEFCLCPWIPLCSALIRTEVIKQTGLLDRRMLNHCSDNDFCIRAGQMGYKVVLVPKSKVYHYHEITTRNLGLDASIDQQLLIQKVRCDFMKNVLETYPLDGNEKKMYELVFREKVSPGEVMPNAQAE